MAMNDRADTVSADSPTAVANAAVVQELFDTVLSGPKDVAALERFLATSFIDHDANSTDPGPAGVATKMQAMWNTLPHGGFRILALVAAGDLVMVRSLLEGGEIRWSSRTPTEWMPDSSSSTGTWSMTTWSRPRWGAPRAETDCSRRRTAPGYTVRTRYICASAQC